MGEAVVGRSPLYLRLGGRRVLQRAARGHGQQTPVHSGGSVVGSAERRIPGWILATAHKLVRVIHAVLHDRPYTDPGIDDERLVVERNAPRWIRSSAPSRRTRGRRIAIFRPPSTT